MSSPSVTVLIDTYNYGRYVEEAIDSVLAQDFPSNEMEILVVDDGSTDDTAERVKKYGTRVQYFQKPNGGQGSAFNFGLARARGRIIAFLDGDDYWFPDRLSTVVAEFEKHPEAGMVYHPLREYHVETGQFREAQFAVISGFVPARLKDVARFDGIMTTSSFRREIIDKLLPVPETLRIQADAYLGNLAIFLAPVVGIGRALGVYRLHGKNFYYKDPSDAEVERLRRRIETRREIVKGMTAWLAAHGFDLRRRDIQIALLRWIVLRERDEFQLSPPGRIRFFRHLLKSYRHQSPLMTPKLRAINGFNAVGGLLLGYKRRHVLDENREKITRWLRYENPVASYLRRKNVSG
jgi:glycosyltransferase involved in cell wall biosynthesis